MTTEAPAPQFHLPQRPLVKAGGGVAAKVACGLLVVVIGLQVYGLYGGGQRPADAVASGGLGGDLQAAALKLEDRNLPLAAVELWRRYLESASPAAAERAKIRYRMGKLRFEGREYDHAVADLYLAEQLLGDRDPDLTRRIRAKVRDCLRGMGRGMELVRETAEQALPGGEEGEAGSLGQRVVAKIGDETVTVADFERLFTEQVEAALPVMPSENPQEALEQRNRLLRQLSDPQAEAQHLQRLLAQQVLAKAAREQKLDEAPSYSRKLALVADELLATELLARTLKQRAVVTPEDLRRYYEANKSQYVTPAQVTLSRVQCDTEEAAREVLEKTHAGESFATLAKTYSTDPQTREHGGQLGTPLVKGTQDIPGLGRAEGLLRAVWSAKPGDVLDQVYHTATGWQVVKVLQRTPRRQRPYEEVQARVEREARSFRVQEVMRQYIQELFDRYQVELHPEAFFRTKKKAGSTTTQPARSATQPAETR